MNSVYCLKCKKNCELNDIEVKQSKNNRTYQIGKCVNCNSKVCRFLKKDKEKSELNKKE